MNLHIPSTFSKLHIGMSFQYSSKENLLLKEENAESKSFDQFLSNTDSSRAWAQRHKGAIVLHIVLITIYTGLTIATCWLFKARNVTLHEPSLVWSESDKAQLRCGRHLLIRSQGPANEAKEHVVKAFDVGPWVTSPFIGDPRPELDEAWHDLLQSEFYQPFQRASEE